MFYSILSKNKNLKLKNINFFPKYRNISDFRKKLELSIDKRLKINIAPKILVYNQVEELIMELKKEKHNDGDFLINQFKNRILPGVDDTSKLKANFLLDIIENRSFSPYIDKEEAINILATMQGGYSIEALVKIICNKTDNTNNDNLKYLASEELKKNILQR